MGQVYLRKSAVSLKMEEHGVSIISDKTINISFASLSSIDKKMCRVILISKSLILLNLSFELDRDAVAFYSVIEKAMNSITAMEQLYAFTYLPDYNKKMAKPYDAQTEYKRLMVNTNQWRFSEINANFTVSNTMIL